MWQVIIMFNQYLIKYNVLIQTFDLMPVRYHTWWKVHVHVCVYKSLQHALLTVLRLS